MLGMGLVGRAAAAAAAPVERQIMMQLGLRGAGEATAGTNALQQGLKGVSDEFNKSTALSQGFGTSVSQTLSKFGVPVGVGDLVSRIAEVHESTLQWYDAVVLVNREIERGGGLTRDWASVSDESFATIAGQMHALQRQYTILSDEGVDKYARATAAAGVRSTEEFGKAMDLIIRQNQLHQVSAEHVSKIYRDMVVNLQMDTEDIEGTFVSLQSMMKETGLTAQQQMGNVTDLSGRLSKLGMAADTTQAPFKELSLILKDSPFYQPEIVQEVSNILTTSIERLTPQQLAATFTSLTTPEARARALGGRESITEIMQQLMPSADAAEIESRMERMLVSPTRELDLLRQVTFQRLKEDPLALTRATLGAFRDTARPELLEDSGQAMLALEAFQQRTEAFDPQQFRAMIMLLESGMTNIVEFTRDLSESMTGFDEVQSQMTEARQQAESIRRIEQTALKQLGEQRTSFWAETKFDIRMFLRTLGFGATGDAAQAGNELLRAQGMTAEEVTEATQAAPEEVELFLNRMGSTLDRLNSADIRSGSIMERSGKSLTVPAIERPADISLAMGFEELARFRLAEKGEDLSGLSEREVSLAIRKQLNQIVAEQRNIAMPIGRTGEFGQAGVIGLNPTQQANLLRLFGDEEGSVERVVDSASWYERILSSFANMGASRHYGGRQLGGPILETGPVTMHAGEFVLSPGDVQRALGHTRQVPADIAQANDLVSQVLGRSIRDTSREVRPGTPEVNLQPTFNLTAIIEPTPVTIVIPLDSGNSLTLQGIMERQSNQSRISPSYQRVHNNPGRG